MPLVKPPSHPAFDALVWKVQELKKAHPRIAIAYVSNVLDGQIDPRFGNRDKPEPNLEDMLRLSVWLSEMRSDFQMELDRERQHRGDGARFKGYASATR
jgi:hypothetical protein